MASCTKDLWTLVYDQMHEERPAGEMELYINELKECEGPLLELACGTGQVLFSLLQEGLDIYGLDISPDPLDVLFAKADAMGIEDIHKRVTRQNMVDFQYDTKFGAIIIPCRSFVFLTSQEEQIACLKNIHKHLKDGGKLIIDVFSPDYERILPTLQPTDTYSPIGTFKHPITGESVEVSTNMLTDILNQFQDVTIRCKMNGTYQITHMYARWTHKEEFKLLFRLAGFKKWNVYDWFDKSEFTDKHGEMVWIVEK